MRRAGALLLASLAAVALPAVSLAHPLGNFTINHYAGIVVGPSEVRLDVVIDQAEIPAFEERLRIDADGDGEVSDAEAAAAREPECRDLASSLDLTVDGEVARLDGSAAGLSFPPGAGGLSTMRLVCGFVAPIDGGLGSGRAIAFADRSHAGRVGWREIVVTGDGATIVGSGLLSTSPSGRLTAYPEDRLASPLVIESVEFRAVAGGPAAARFVPPDAEPVGGIAPRRAAGAVTGPGSGGSAVPGGVAADVPEIFASPELSLDVLIVAILTALALGAGHALTPGHGKTLMVAYLVGTRGSPLHAAGLGLSVSVSHTLGILVLAGLIVAAGAALPAEVVTSWLPLIAALTIVAIGTWMLVAEVRRRRTSDLRRNDPPHSHPHAHPHTHDRDRRPAPTITWRSLFALGLAGGIVPSTSALVILLASIAAGRPAFGVVLVVAFGLGMTAVMGGIGIGLVLAQGRIERLTAGSGMTRLTGWMPLAAACLVLVLGVWLAGQALVGSSTL